MGFLFKKASVYLALVGIILSFSLWLILTRPNPPAQPVAMPAINPYIDSIAASGIVEATDRNISISSPISGLVMDVFVNAGDRVKEGQPLFQIDDRDLRAQLLVQKANIIVSEAQVKRLQDQLARFKSVQDPRAVSADEVTTRENDVAVAVAQLEAAKAQAFQTQSLIDRLVVKAPRDGEILQSNIRTGEYVLANMTPPPMLLGDLSKLQVRVDVDEQNASILDIHAPAVAYPKNNTILAIPLKFDRVEPYVLPKKSLTGASDERVDTRVLQVIYSFKQPDNFHIYVGQQLDVFIKDQHSADVHD